MSSSNNRKNAAPNYAAALGACLSFASALLTASVAPSQLCTKEALSAIVIEAHRVGQHVSRLDAMPVSDPRRLLKTLQRLEQHAPEWHCTSTQLKQLAFEDLSWDAHGDAAQSLALEVLELEARATDAGRSVCILLALQVPATDEQRSQVSECVLLWLPNSSSSSIASVAKPQYLLYVCPGRVKVVKSVTELLKKMRDEVAVLNDAHAVYTCWALVRAPAPKRTPRNVVVESSNQQQHQQQSQCDDQSVQARRSTLLVPPPLVTVPVSPRCSSSLSLSDSTALQPQLLPLAATDSTTTPLAASSPGDPSVRRSRNDALIAANDVQTTSTREMTVHASTRRESSRRAVSMSHASALSSQSTRTNRSQPQGSNAQCSRVWQSLDSELMKPSITTQRSAPERTDTCSHDRDRWQGQLPSTDDTIAATATPVDPVDPDLANTVESFESFEQQQRQDALTSAQARAGMNEASIFTFALGTTPSRLESVSARSSCCLSVVALESESTRARVSSVNSCDCDSDSDNASRSPQCTLSPVARNSIDSEADAADVELVDAIPHEHQEPEVPARKNYRAKLGNRVWFALECAADRLQQQQQEQQQAVQPRVAAPSCVQHERRPRGVDSATLRTTRSRDDVTPAAIGTTDTVVTFSSNVQQATAPLSSSSVQHSTEMRPSARPLLAASTCDTIAERASECDRPIDATSTIASCSLTAVVDTAAQTDTVLSNTPAADESSRSRSGNCAVARDALHHSTAWPSALDDTVSRSSSSDAVRASHAVVTATLSDAYTVEFSHTIESAPQLPVASVRLSTDSRASRERRSSTVGVDDNDDEAFVEHQWASTRTVYGGADSEPLPFTVRGRVPIRSRTAQSSASDRQQHHGQSDADDSPSSSDNDDAAPPVFASTAMRQPLQDVSSQQTHASAELEPLAPSVTRDATPHKHVATFIAFEPDSNAPTTSTVSRDARLAMLRQRKLQQLHRARDEQQQRKRQHQTTSEHFAASGSTTANTDALGFTSGSSAVAGASRRAAASPPTNRQLIQNALEYTLLAGASMERERLAALAALAASPATTFVVLLKSAQDLKFRGLYAHAPERDAITRLYASSKCPALLASSVIGQFFRYNSGKKAFVAVDARSFTITTDACALKDELVFRKRGAPLSKALL